MGNSGGRHCLKFSFNGELNSADASVLVVKWRDFVASIPNDENVVLIYDATKMTGYESGAQVCWQKALKEMRSQIDLIWLICDSQLIQMGASVITVFSGLNIKSSALKAKYSVT